MEEKLNDPKQEEELDELQKFLTENPTARKVVAFITPWWEKIKPVLEKHRDQIMVGLVIFCIVFPFICAKSRDKKFVNHEVGYEVTGPHNWDMKISPDKMTVKYHKYKGRQANNSMIKMDVEFGNPYGTTPLDYIVNGLIPQVRYTYEKVEGGFVDLREEPYELNRDGREWAIASFYVNRRDLQILYVTMTNDYVVILGLNSVGTEHEQDEELLKRTFDSIVIRQVKEEREHFDRVKE